LGVQKAELEAVLQLAQDRKLWSAPAELLLAHRSQMVSLSLLGIPARLSIFLPTGLTFAVGVLEPELDGKAWLRGTSSSAQTPREALAALQQHLKT